MVEPHFGYESNGFHNRDFSNERLYYQKHRVLGGWFVRIMTMEGESLDEMTFEGPEPTMSELTDVVAGYASALGARGYV